MKKYIKLISIIFYFVAIVLILSGCVDRSASPKSETKKEIIFLLENRFGKEGNFQIVKMEKYERYLSQYSTSPNIYWKATIKTSYFNETFEYDTYYDSSFFLNSHSSTQPHERGAIRFLEALFKDKYGIGLYEYLESDDNLYFSSKKQETENMLNSTGKDYNLDYKIIPLSDSDFENFGKLPSLEDINSKTKHRAYIHIINTQIDSESMLKDIKKICSFYAKRSFLDIPIVYYYGGSSSAGTWDANAIINKDSNEVSLRIPDMTQNKQQTYIYDNDFNFTQKKKELREEFANQM